MDSFHQAFVVLLRDHHPTTGILSGYKQRRTSVVHLIHESRQIGPKFRIGNVGHWQRPPPVRLHVQYIVHVQEIVNSNLSSIFGWNLNENKKGTIERPIRRIKGSLLVPLTGSARPLTSPAWQFAK